MSTRSPAFGVAFCALKKNCRRSFAYRYLRDDVPAKAYFDYSVQDKLNAAFFCC
jgi:hypothetical protein